MENQILEMNNVRLIHLNFEGRATKFNREGDRNFSVVIEDPDMIRQLIEDGWNVKTKVSAEDPSSTYSYLPVKVKFDHRFPKLNPKMYLKTRGRTVLLTEEGIGVLDQVDIQSVSMDIRPYHYEVQGKTGITAYLVAGEVVQRTNRFTPDQFEDDVE